MKLRNKKTGEIIEYDSFGFRRGLSNGWNDFIPKANSLAELNAEWEDYKPAEPLIKDEKIRKAVRAWAEANRDLSDELIYAYDTNKPYCELVDNQSGAMIRFNFLFIKELHTYEFYSIAELCGEEEDDNTN